MVARRTIQTNTQTGVIKNHGAKMALALEEGNSPLKAGFAVPIARVLVEFACYRGSNEPRKAGADRGNRDQSPPLSCLCPIRTCARKAKGHFFNRRKEGEFCAEVGCDVTNISPVVVAFISHRGRC